MVALDLLVSAGVVLFVWKHRIRVVALPVIATYVHWSIQSRLVRAPHSTLQWGLTTLALGFAMLFASLLTSWRYERRAPSPQNV